MVHELLNFQKVLFPPIDFSISMIIFNSKGSHGQIHMEEKDNLFNNRDSSL